MGIHSTVPESTMEAKGEPYVIARQLRMVTHYMMGKRNAKTSDELMKLLGYEPKGTNQKLRAAAKILLVEEQVPIISSSNGFYIATDPKELAEYKQNLTSRLLALERDIAAVNTILTRKAKEQKTMFDEED